MAESHVIAHSLLWCSTNRTACSCHSYGHITLGLAWSIYIVNFTLVIHAFFGMYNYGERSFNCRLIHILLGCSVDESLSSENRPKNFVV